MLAAEIPFYKLSGAGNDFVALIEPGCLDPGDLTSFVRQVCRRGHSLGADGVFVLERENRGEPGAASARPEDETPRVRMHHFNSDGSRAELCGNGTRCAARLALELGWTAGETVLLTDAGALRASARHDGTVRVQTPRPARPPRRFDLAQSAADGNRLQELARVAKAWFLEVGVPHVVVIVEPEAWPALAKLPIDLYGPALRHHPSLAHGANANFATQQAEASAAAAGEAVRFILRTWERGVEGETLACGSGAVAAATVLNQECGVDFPINLQVRGGETLRVGREEDLSSSPGTGGLWQEGPTTLVARGILLQACSEAQT